MNMRPYYLLIGISLWFTATAWSQAYPELLQRAREAYQDGRFKRAGKLYDEAFALYSPRTEELHQAVSAWAQAGKEKQAFAVMELGVRSGWITLDRLLNDPTLQSLHEEERWDELTQQLARYAMGSNVELQQELTRVAERDQYYRQQMHDLAQEHGWGAPVIREMHGLQAELDAANLSTVAEIIEEHGYPGRSLVGPQGSTAFLVIQRADLATQEAYLPILSQAADAGELLWADLAMLIDRIQMRRELPQIYGTQVIQSANGLPEFYRIENPEQVNERRREVGLMPIEVYAEKFGIQW